MNIICPHCNFSKSINPEQLPDHTVKATCPNCKQVFRFDKTLSRSASPLSQPHSPSQVDGPPDASTTCPACGMEQEAGNVCAACGVVYAKWYQRQGTDQGSETNARKQEEEGREQLASIQRAASYTAADALPKAGFWIRVVAYLIDSFILGSVQLLLGLMLGLSVGAMGDLSQQGETAMGVVTWLFGAVISLTYAVFFIGYCGQTPGKMAVRIKVILTSGSDISYGKAALREILGKFVSGILLGIGYLMVAFDSQKQGLHDRIANTYVVKL